MTSLSVHDLTPAEYERLSLPESFGRTARWKVIETASITIAFFRPQEHSDAFEQLETADA